MHLYQKHILNLLGKFYATIASTFIIIVILGQFIKLLNKYVGLGNNILQALYITLFTAPDILVRISPIAIFCAIVATHHKLANDNELVILESSGISKYQLAKTFLLFAAFITALNLFITSLISPLALRAVKRNSSEFQNQYASNMLEEGVFNNISKNLTIYVNKKEKNNNLQGIVIYDNTHNKQTIISAEQAKFLSYKGKIKLLMTNGTRQQVNKHGQLDVLYFEKSKYSLSPTSTTTENSLRKPEEMIIHKLISREKLSNRKVLHELHKRISWPLLNMLFSAIALLSSFSSTFSRKWSTKSTAIGSAGAALSMLIFFSINNMAIKTPNINLYNYAFIIFMSFLCINLLRLVSMHNGFFTNVLNKLLKPNSK